MFQILKNVPVPVSTRGPGRDALYPFVHMGPGDSFIVPVADGVESIKVADRVRGAAATWRKRNLSALSFSVRAFKNEEGKNVIGVWATKSKPKVAAAA